MDKSTVIVRKIYFYFLFLKRLFKNVFPIKIKSVFTFLLLKLWIIASSLLWILRLTRFCEFNITMYWFYFFYPKFHNIMNTMNIKMYMLLDFKLTGFYFICLRCDCYYALNVVNHILIFSYVLWTMCCSMILMLLYDNRC